MQAQWTFINACDELNHLAYVVHEIARSCWLHSQSIKVEQLRDVPKYKMKWKILKTCLKSIASIVALGLWSLMFSMKNAQQLV